MKPVPAVNGTISAHRLFDNKKQALWLVGVAERDRFLVVPEKVVAPLCCALAQMNGERTEQEIAAHVLAQCGTHVDIGALQRKAQAAGLFSSDAHARSTRLRRTRALRTWRIPEQMQRLDPRATTRLAQGWHWLMLSAALIGITALAAFQLTGPHEVLPSQLGVGVLAAALLVSALLHEIGHAAAAIKDNLRPTTLNAGLYLGFIPMLYIDLPGIYLRPQRVRVRIWAAGCATNGALLLLTAGMQPYLDGDAYRWAEAMVAANAALLFCNLLPFLPTDGYFVFSTLLQQHNLREHSIVELRNLVRSGRAHFGRLAFAIGYLGVVALALLGAAQLVRDLLVNEGNRLPLLICACVASLLFLVGRRRSTPLLSQPGAIFQNYFRRKSL